MQCNLDNLYHAAKIVELRNSVQCAPSKVLLLLFVFLFCFLEGGVGGEGPYEWTVL